MTGLETYLKEKTVSLTASEYVHNITEFWHLMNGARLLWAYTIQVTPDKYPVIHHGIHEVKGQINYIVICITEWLKAELYTI